MQGTPTAALIESLIPKLQKFSKEEHDSHRYRKSATWGDDATHEDEILSIAVLRLMEMEDLEGTIAEVENLDGWLRVVVQNAARRAADQKYGKKGQMLPAGWGAASVAETFVSVEGNPHGRLGQGADLLHVLGNRPENASGLGNPENELDRIMVEQALLGEVARILATIKGEKQRLVAALYYTSDYLDTPTIAKKLGMKLNTVEQLLSRARKGLLPEEAESLSQWRAIETGQRTTYSKGVVKSTLVEVIEGLHS